MPLNILHLSDLHIGQNEFIPERLVTSMTMNFGIDDIIGQIVVTGDIFDGKSLYGKNANVDPLYKQAKDFFEALIKRINTNQKINLSLNDVLFVPGNHEMDKSKFTKNIKKESLFDNYRNFLEYFYGSMPEEYHAEYLSVYKIMEVEKVIIIGFNSTSCDANGTYGEIQIEHLAEIMGKLNIIGSQPDYDEYKIVVLLHHHFYHFEERIKNNKDKSSLINQETFIEQLQMFNIAVFLHGHKHINFIKRVNINVKLDLLDKVVTTVACGSTNRDDVNSNGFNIITIYEHNHISTLKVKEYIRAERDTFQPGRGYTFPIIEKVKIINSLEKLLADEQSYYGIYTDLMESGINSSNYIYFLNKTVGICSGCCEILNNNKKIILHMFFVAHYCANYDNKAILDKIKASYIDIFKDDNDCSKIFLAILACKDICGLNYVYSTTAHNFIHSSSCNQDREVIIFSLISFYICNLYRTLNQDAEKFFNNNIKDKTDINVETIENIQSSIRNNDLNISFNMERRAITVAVKCESALAHKVVILIFKEFELGLIPFEEDFADVGFKMYYILSRIKHTRIKDNNLESHTFNAFIPKLLDLLAGEHIYFDNNVFIRELIQNCIDAISLRQRVDEKVFKSNGIIEIFYNPDNHRVLTIKDNGAGMTKYHIERYLTTVGRSFYKSDEFDRLSKEKKYIPISQFGIGFLSSFNVSKSIRVKTQYWNSSIESHCNYLEIPNIDGCFFIEENDAREIGTTIELTLKDNLDILNLGTYIKDHFCVIPYPIHYKGEMIVEKNAFISDLERNTEKFGLIFKVHCTEEGVIVDQGEEGDNSYGIYLYRKDNDIFRREPEITCMCNGIKVDNFDISMHFKIIKKDYFDILINLSSENIKLDVSRDNVQKIDSLNEDLIKKSLDKKIKNYLSANEKELKANLPYIVLSRINYKMFSFKHLSFVYDDDNNLKVGFKNTHTFKDAYNILQYFGSNKLPEIANCKLEKVFNNIAIAILNVLRQENYNLAAIEIINNNINEFHESHRVMDEVMYRVMNRAMSISRDIVRDMKRTQDSDMTKAMGKVKDKLINTAMNRDMASVEDRDMTKANDEDMGRHRDSTCNYIIMYLLNCYFKKADIDGTKNIFNFCFIMQYIPIYLSAFLTLGELTNGVEIDLKLHSDEKPL